MRVIVPLQGVVQGRGGVVLGSVIPCVLFYLLQLYLKRNRSDPNRDPPPSPEVASPANSLPNNPLVELSVLPRTLSRIFLSPRSSGPVCVSGRANSIARGGDSLTFIGMRKFLEDPYDELDNPTGIFQLCVAENKVGV